MSKLNKFLRNKNVVTILGIIVILILLYFGYTATINSTVQPILVPVAAEKILPSTKITEEKVKFINVSKMLITDNVYSKNESSKVIGMYTNVNVTIPAGSMFYKEWLIEEDKLPGNWLKEIDFEAGEEAYYFGVNVVSTFGNSILPDSYIDIYMRAYDASGNAVYGKLLQNIKIIAVHDSNGKNVFADSENVGSPAYLLFALSHDNYNLLRRAEYLEGQGISLSIAPKGYSVDEKGTLVSSETLKNYVNEHTSSVTDDQIEAELKAKEEAESNSEEETEEIEEEQSGLGRLFG